MVWWSASVIILYYARWQHKNKKNRAAKMKNTHNYRRKIKIKKTIKSKSEYTSRASPNGPLNIYVANMPWRNMID